MSRALWSMYTTMNFSRYHSSQRRLFAILLLPFIAMAGLPSTGYANQLFSLHLAAKPFSPTMCKGNGHSAFIRIQVAHHRDLIVRRIPGQYIPNNTDEARQKDYNHYIELTDLTNGRVTKGAIAFDTQHGVIFTDTHPGGLSRPTFINEQPENLRPVSHQALNTFLYIHRILNAAIDACRAYPPKVAYETDDEILRIEAGKHRYRSLVHRHNRQPIPKDFTIRHETGYTDGFVNPHAGKQANVSYHAMNPLNFYVPSS
ncbi:MAG: hypothetical protein NPIRA01_11250 [Nitrospirales bacterium]|nr:MAG: hypothetical protein NPIRA01_11250 [Nitrospirales bacterium]